MSNESITKTFSVATCLCVVCAIIVSLSDVSLKGMQQQNKALDKQINILRAAGLVDPGAKVSAQEAEKLFANAQIAVVDLQSGTIVDDVDPADVEKDKDNFVTLSKEDDVAQIKTAPKRVVAYLFKDQTGALQTAVLPIVGTGLWSTLHGFLALNGDLTTVAHIVFYDHGETPGLGGEISNPVWTAKWEGKTAVNEQGEPVIRVVKGAARSDSEIDGISGATLTGAGVTRTVTFWLGDNGFGPFLNNQRGASVPSKGDATPDSNDVEN